MKVGAIATVLVVAVSLCSVAYTFLTNANPYVTIAQAKSQTDSVHVVGDLDKQTLKTDALKSLVQFEMTDEHGDRMNVRYEGPPPANMGSATRVVVVGQMKAGTFEANKILLKCPSKYEGGES